MRDCFSTWKMNIGQTIANTVICAVALGYGIGVDYYISPFEGYLNFLPQYAGYVFLALYYIGLILYPLLHIESMKIVFFPTVMAVLELCSVILIEKGPFYWYSFMWVELIVAIINITYIFINTEYDFDDRPYLCDQFATLFMVSSIASIGFRLSSFSSDFFQLDPCGYNKSWSTYGFVVLSLGILCCSRADLAGTIMWTGIWFCTYFCPRGNYMSLYLAIFFLPLFIGVFSTPKCCKCCREKTYMDGKDDDDEEGACHFLGYNILVNLCYIFGFGLPILFGSNYKVSITGSIEGFYYNQWLLIGAVLVFFVSMLLTFATKWFGIGVAGAIVFNCVAVLVTDAKESPSYDELGEAMHTTVSFLVLVGFYNIILSLFSLNSRMPAASFYFLSMFSGLLTALIFTGLNFGGNTPITIVLMVIGGVQTLSGLLVPIASKKFDGKCMEFSFPLIILPGISVITGSLAAAIILAMVVFTLFYDIFCVCCCLSKDGDTHTCFEDCGGCCTWTVREIKD